MDYKEELKFHEIHYGKDAAERLRKRHSIKEVFHDISKIRQYIGDFLKKDAKFPLLPVNKYGGRKRYKSSKI